jgi:hypothetical protein
MNVSRQIGWSNESNLLYQILKQLNRLTSVLFGLKEAATPKYKVYTALLTQNGADDFLELSSGPVTKGVTYVIAIDSDGDFTNVGAPNNNENTFFVAINNETPTSYGSCVLNYNPGTPVANVLDNTIGNIWFTYLAVGVYSINSNGLFTSDQTTALTTFNDCCDYSLIDKPFIAMNTFNTVDSVLISSAIDGVYTDNVIKHMTIEIRVYN